MKKVSLALQGGGSHGAFTWGVLEHIIKSKEYQVTSISATGIGAINAVIFAYGMLTSEKHTIKLLKQFWKRVSEIGGSGRIAPSLFSKFTNPFIGKSQEANYMAFDYITKVISPYHYNVFDYNPIKDIVRDLVNFEELRQKTNIDIFINATDVQTGMIKIFDNSRLSIDAVMASACQPYLYKAVQIDGRYYWDGRYSGNPPLFPLTHRYNPDDIIIVQINPMNIEEVPIMSQEIQTRINDITYNSNLLRELYQIAYEAKIKGKETVHLHSIHSDDIIAGLGGLSKLNTDLEFLEYLKEVGMQASHDFFSLHGVDIGSKSSMNMKRMLG